MTFAECVEHTGLNLSHDYVLDLLDHSSKLTAYLLLYTRGGYLVDLSVRTQPTWLVP